MTADLLAAYWVHDVSAKLLNGGGADGESFAAPINLTGFWSDGTKIVRDGNGQEVVSSAQFAYPKHYPRVPVGSLVTAPAAFGGLTRTVVASSLGDGGGNPTPDHYQLAMR